MQLLTQSMSQKHSRCSFHWQGTEAEPQELTEGATSAANNRTLQRVQLVFLRKAKDSNKKRAKHLVQRASNGKEEKGKHWDERLKVGGNLPVQKRRSTERRLKGELTLWGW